MTHCSLCNKVLCLDKSNSWRSYTAQMRKKREKKRLVKSTTFLQLLVPVGYMVGGAPWPPKMANLVRCIDAALPLRTPEYATITLAITITVTILITITITIGLIAIISMTTSNSITATITHCDSLDHMTRAILSSTTDRSRKRVSQILDQLMLLQ